MMLQCPLCYQECKQKFTKKNILLGLSCEIITDNLFYHRFIYFSDEDFMLAIYYPSHKNEQCIITGAYTKSHSPNYIFSLKNKTIHINKFLPCFSLDIIHKYLKLAVLI